MLKFLYYLSFAVGLLTALVLNIQSGKNRDIAKKDSACLTVLGFIGAVFGAMLMAEIYNAALKALSGGTYFADSRVSLYGGLLFMPLMMFIPLKIMKKEVNDVYSALAPGVFSLLGVAKLGCLCYGCCYGIPWEYGIYNRFAGEKVFPVQLVESLFNFGLAFLCYYLAKNKKRKNVYPIGLILYGVIRFFVQFLRHNETSADSHVFFFADFWQTVSLAAIMSGFIWLLCIRFINKAAENRKNRN